MVVVVRMTMALMIDYPLSKQGSRAGRQTKAIRIKSVIVSVK